MALCAVSPCEEGDSADWIVVPGEVVARRYRVQRELTRGGMSAIVLAHDERLDRPTVLKILLPRYAEAPRLVECFCAEARVLARISSRHVVSVLDQGVIPRAGRAELPFLALELLRGQNLRNYAVRRWPLELARVARFGLEACEGVAAIHAQGITHQDLKPDNLFVAIEPDGGECIKVLDLGIALRPGTPPGKGTEGAGSPGYMSPEQLNAPRCVDARSDIWSLGAVLYELFVGRSPFECTNAYDFCSRVVGDEFGRLSRIRPDLPIGIVLAIERCLESDRQRRFQNVAELAACLAPYAEAKVADETERVRRTLERAARHMASLDLGEVCEPDDLPKGSAAPLERLPRPSSEVPLL